MKNDGGRIEHMPDRFGLLASGIGAVLYSQQIECAEIRQQPLEVPLK
jgi:hypothetical protein